MNNKFKFLMVCLAGAAACAGPKPRPAPPPLPPVAEPAVSAQNPDQPAAPAVLDDGKAVQIELKVEAVTSTGQGWVEFGQKLRAGDKLALHVTPSEAAYIYVALASAQEQPVLLYPAQGNSGIVAANESERVPPVGKWFKLDATSGREDIYVYGAKRPLAVDDVLARVKADSETDRLAMARDEAAAKGKKRKPPKQGGRGHLAQNDAPGLVTAETRALELVEDVPPEAGVTKKHFSIKHGK